MCFEEISLQIVGMSLGAGKLTIEEGLPCLLMRCHALEESKSVAHSVRRVGREHRRRKERIHGDDFLKQGGHDAWRTAYTAQSRLKSVTPPTKLMLTEGMPQHEGKIIVVLSLLRQL